MSIHLHMGDLPEGHGLDRAPALAVDTETMGLNLARDPLCLVQLSTGDGEAHLVQMNRTTYDCPRLKALLGNPETEKILHFARFDIAMIRRWLGVELAPVFCTKMASKLARTYTDRHGLKDVARELIGVEISKQQQSSDWGAAVLTEEQRAYAASDVLYLHDIRDRLVEMLEREGRMDLARRVFAALGVRAELDLAGWGDVDVFAHG